MMYSRGAIKLDLENILKQIFLEMVKIGLMSLKTAPENVSYGGAKGGAHS
jgi:glutamate dehydrogenase/leucine dehydrogenase